MKKILLIIALVFLTNISAAGNSYTLSYLYGGTSVTYTNYIENAKNVLNCISPDYFVLNDNGTLNVTKVDSRFIDSMHGLNIKVKPFLSNNWDKPSGIAGLNNKEALSEQISRAVYDNNLDGVDVDIQNVSHIYRELYTEFVKLLREKMPNKEISVAVAANPNNWTLGWHGSYDYENLAKYSDYLMIMAYDESFYNSPPGPVASKTFVENSIKYALKYTTPQKIILGMPFYGRYWKSGEGGNALTAKDAEMLIEKYNAQKIYDENTESAKVFVTINADDIKPKLWGGRILEAGSYEIWYDDLRSIKYKLNLAEKYNLKGTGSWAMGQENIDVWSLYKQKTTPGELDPIDTIELPPEVTVTTPFTDIKNHWAYENILVVNEKGWMSGNPNKTFLPNNNLTRGECAEMIMKISNLPEIQNWVDYSFIDSQISWANKSIANARYYGFITGKDDNLYYPNNNITREEFAAIIDRTFNLAVSVNFLKTEFKDLEKDRWSYNSIAILSENNVITGYEDGTFKPTSFITRAETAAILSKLLGYGINTPKTTNERALQLPR